jgi:cardiolipin synthase A/B
MKKHAEGILQKKKYSFPRLEVRLKRSFRIDQVSSISIRTLIRNLILSIFSVQLVTAIILVIFSTIRDRGKKNRSFPHIALDEVQLEDNCLQLYGYGQDLYDGMLEAIDNAKECIYIETYIWKDDEAGWAFKTHLARKAAEGVEVYVVFDRIGNLVVPHNFKATFDPAIHLQQYLSVSSILHLFDPRRYALDHRKLLIVDRKISFIGGYNIGSLYAASWRDTHLRIQGPLSREIASSFIDFWNRFSNKNDHITTRVARDFDPLVTLHGNDALRLTFPIRDMYIEAINRASNSILLSNAYFVPDRSLLEALKDAAERGVNVRIMVPWTSNHIITDWISHSYFSECLEAGIHVIGYTHAMLHAKTCTIDGKWSTVGTANMDRLSSLGNYEINVEIYSPEFAQQMERLFACDIDKAINLTAEQWHHRPWYAKLSEHILTPLRFMM